MVDLHAGRISDPDQGWLPAFSANLARLSGALAGIGVGAIFVMVLIEVVSRSFFGQPTSWVNEFSTYVLVASGYLGAAYAHHGRANVRVEIILDTLLPARRNFMEQVVAWLGLLFVMFAAWQASLFTYSEWLYGARSFVLSFPRWLYNLPIALGLIAFIVTLLDEIWTLRKPRVAWTRHAVPALFIAAGVALVFVGLHPYRIQSIGFDIGAVLLVVTFVVACFLWSDRAVFLTVVSTAAAIAVTFWMMNGAPAGPTSAVLVALVMALLFTGIPVSLGLGLIGAMAFYLLLPIQVPGEIAARAGNSLMSFSFTAVPMYVVMGTLLLRSGIASELFAGMLAWLGRVPGGLAHAGIGASSLFAAVSGSSLATAATIGTIACPEMTKHGYGRKLAYGSVAAGGTLGILIPPSIPMIVYGTTVGISITQLFFAGILPGLLLTAAFMGVVFIWALVKPEVAPRASFPEAKQLFGLTLKMAPVFGIIGLILVSIYGGIVTPTEAGALGAFAALVLCMTRRILTWEVVKSTLLDTGKICAFMFLIVFGASLLSYLFEYLQLSEHLLRTVTANDLSPLMVMVVICIVYIVLGMFIDSISMILMTLPVVYPLVIALGFDGVWFGIILVVLVEIGLITPPVGMNLFILQGIGAGAKLGEIAAGALPFVFTMIAFIGLLYAFPEIVLIVPEWMKQ